MPSRCTALLLLLASGCVDTKGRYDAFNERFEDYKKRLEDQEHDAAAGDAGACALASVSDLEGRYLYAFAVALDKSKPILMSLDLTAIKGSKDEMKAVFHALTVEGLEPVGEDIETTLTLNDASFMFEKVALVVPGSANPLQPGVDARAEVMLSGVVCAPDEGEPAFLCGDGDGSITDPVEIPLAGSEFGVVRVEEGDPWPEPVSTCAMGKRS